jgi:hypothetical protein
MGEKIATASPSFNNWFSSAGRPLQNTIRGRSPGMASLRKISLIVAFSRNSSLQSEKQDPGGKKSRKISINFNCTCIFWSPKLFSSTQTNDQPFSFNGANVVFISSSETGKRISGGKDSFAIKSGSRSSASDMPADVLKPISARNIFSPNARAS